MNWSNAGACSLMLMQYGPALTDFLRAEKAARKYGQMAPLGSTLNNLANLYLHTGQPEHAMTVAAEALKIPSEHLGFAVRAPLEFQMAMAQMQLGRFDEARPFYRQSTDELIASGDLDTAARELGLIGGELVKGRRLAEAEPILTQGLSLTRIHRLSGAANILRNLANLREAQGDAVSAAKLFDAALAEPPGVTPRWSILADRGAFRLKLGNLEGSLGDFREARQIAFQVRADMVPADQDRVRLENGLSALMEGLVDSGNRLAGIRNQGNLLRETFDAAETDRLWSLRALVPGPDDWRTRLPDHYWELLARYQAAQRSAITESADADRKTMPLRIEMQQIEAAASSANRVERSGSPLDHVRKTMGADTVLFSFHVSATSSWVWAVDREHTAVFPLASKSVLASAVSRFRESLASGKGAVEEGADVYQAIFGAVSRAFLEHKHWLLEPDGPLYELPFAALVTGQNGAGEPLYLIERASLRAVPSALLLDKGSVRRGGEFLGVGDPVYNLADSRFAGSKRNAELTLARLPNTAREVEACARAWNSGRTRILNGQTAATEEVESAIRLNPAVIHFATHVVAAPGEFGSGLIALSLNAQGAMGLLGPKQIVARPVHGSLVVMDGCYSTRGEALPSAGLMGLTRAWIGAGASAVMATQWDVPDDASRSLMVDFYRAFNGSPDIGPAEALQAAQKAALNRGNGRKLPTVWAGYFLLSRI